MANDLAPRTASLQAVLSSTDCVALQRISLGKVQHPGMPVRRYLAGGLKLTDDDRERISRKIAEIRDFCEVSPKGGVSDAALALISKMLLAYPMAGSSAEAGRARGEAYLHALDDVPPWAIAETIKRWHRGEGGGRDANYRFAPAPAELRYAAMQLLQPAKQAIAHLSMVLSAMTIDEAMDPTPIETPSRRPVLRVI